MSWVVWRVIIDLFTQINWWFPTWGPLSGGMVLHKVLRHLKTTSGFWEFFEINCLSIKLERIKKNTSQSPSQLQIACFDGKLYLEMWNALHTRRIARISPLKPSSCILPTSNTERLQTGLIFHEFHNYSASFTKKKVAGTKTGRDCSKLHWKTTGVQEEEAALSCKQYQSPSKFCLPLPNLLWSLY